MVFIVRYYSLKALNNISEKDLDNKDKIDNLLKWISEEKDFNRTRIEKLINNAIKKRKK